MYRLQTIYISFLFFALMLITKQGAAQELADNDIKKNTSSIAEPLKQINSLDPKVFEYKTDQYRHLELPQGQHYGFIAEDFQQVFPSMVYRKSHQYMIGKNSYRNAMVKKINLEELIPVLVASIKEQQLQLDKLRAELESMKKR